MKYEHLFSPITINQLHLPNRVIMGAMHLGIEGKENGIDKLVAFYQQRAKENVGLIITGGAAVSPEGIGGSDFLKIYKDEHVKELKKIVDGVHEVGGKIALQLFHAGRIARKQICGYKPVAPSAIRSPIGADTPKALSTTEITNIILAFAEGAKRAKDAGFDAIEISGSEGFLINQFISPVTNKRTDQWGGSFRNRIRFPIAVVKAVRKAVGPDYPIIFRMSGLDLIEGSTTESETLELARRLMLASVDALNIGIGWNESAIPTLSMQVPRANFVPIAMKIKEVVSIPVIVNNRINNPDDANFIIQNNEADLVSMARPFLADPQILTKAKLGRTEEINTCIACNQGCLDHIFTGRQVTCLVNPEAGRETELSLVKTQTNKHILVVGAGPAGLEAAKTLAMRNHRVTLVDENEEIGGKINYAKKVPGKEEFNEMLRYFQVMLEKHSVEQKLNYRLEKNDPLLKEADEIVIATGTVPRIPDIPGIRNNPYVYTYQDVFEGKIPSGDKIIIIGGTNIACNTALYLLEQKNYNIMMLEQSEKFGKGIGKTTRWATLLKLKEKNVEMIGNVTYNKIKDNTVHITVNECNVFLKADTIIIAAGQAPNNSLYKEIKNSYPNVHVIGGAYLTDGLDAERSIFEATLLARSL